MTEALIACYEATQDQKFLDRALLVADKICNRAAGQTQGLVWEHFDENWTPQLDFDNDKEALKIFRPWGFQPDPVWKSNFGRPTPSTRRRPRNCICSMAWRFHAIDALSP